MCEAVNEGNGLPPRYDDKVLVADSVDEAGETAALLPFDEVPGTHYVRRV